MQILINRKHGRRIKLNKSERTLLDNARALLDELSSVTANGDAFELASDSIACGLAELDKLPLVPASTEGAGTG